MPLEEHIETSSVLKPSFLSYLVLRNQDFSEKINRRGPFNEKLTSMKYNGKEMKKDVRRFISIKRGVVFLKRFSVSWKSINVW